MSCMSTEWEEKAAIPSIPYDRYTNNSNELNRPSGVLYRQVVCMFHTGGAEGISTVQLCIASLFLHLRSSEF